MALICDYCTELIEGERKTATIPLSREVGEMPTGYVEGLDFHPECAEVFRKQAKKVKGKRPEKEEGK